MNNIEYKLQVLKEVAEKLNKANVLWAIGSSSLLYFKGVVDTFNDFDIFISVNDVEKAKDCFDALGELQPQYYDAENFGTHTFLEYVVDGIEFDFVGGFSIINEGKEYCFPVEGSIESYYDLNGVTIPCQTLKQWISCYRLMKREYKAVLIEEYLKESGEL